MNTEVMNATDVQGLVAHEGSTETGTISNVQVSNNSETIKDPVKEFFMELLNKQPTREKKVMVIDILRDIWDFYDDTLYFAVFGMSDERVEFLQECFMNPLNEATDEIAKEIGYESMKDRIWRIIRITMQSNTNRTTDDEEVDRPPF